MRNIIFDIGNVLTDFRWREMLAERGFTGEYQERIARATVKNPVWAEYDRGVWSEKEIMDAFVEKDPEIAEDIHKAFDSFTGMVSIRDYAIPWLQALKKAGYHVFYLSNFSYKAETECADCLTFLPEMEGGILSYKDKLIKPDPAIYQLLLDRYGLKAEESVFIDDTLPNVEAAKGVGIHGIHFVTKEQVDEELHALGVNW